MTTRERYDPTADAAYVYLRKIEPGDAVRQVELFGGLTPGMRLVDYDREGRVLGVEFLAVSEGIDLDGVPQAEAVYRALLSLDVGIPLHPPSGIR